MNCDDPQGATHLKTISSSAFSYFTRFGKGLLVLLGLSSDRDKSLSPFDFLAARSYSKLCLIVSSHFVCSRLASSPSFSFSLVALFCSLRFFRPMKEVFLVLEGLVDAEKQLFTGETEALITQRC